MSTHDSFIKFQDKESSEAKQLVEVPASASELIDVDIYQGIKSLKKETEISSDTFRNSGIKYIAKLIRRYFIDTNIAKNIMVEYSLVASTLDPDDPDKLQCCSFIISDDAEFKSKIEEYYTACIDETVKRFGISIYQHPQFLFDIDVKGASGKVIYVKTDSNELSQKYNDILVINGIAERDRNKYRTVRRDSSIYGSSFALERPFESMTSAAGQYAKCSERKSWLDLQEFLHCCCYQNISKQRKQSSTYISFPILGSRASNQLDKFRVGSGKPLQGVGACFIYFEPNNDIDNKAIASTIEKTVYEIGEIIRFISANYSFNLGLQLQENARKQAIKSAKAAIMSRNMSHNLGSHVMSYLKQHLGSVKDLLNDRVLSMLFDDESDMVLKLKTLNSEITDCDKVALPFLVGLGQFISYLQERQDFIATIATDFIPYYSNVNFKDFVYDELNPDKRYERHKDRANMQIDNILLGNIARSEGLGRPTSPTKKIESSNNLGDIIIKFRDFDGNPIVEGSKDEQSLEEMRQYDVSLPGGIVGRQAIFSIVENVIRNAAKHGNWRESKKLELTFDIYTKEDIAKDAAHKPLDDDNEPGHTLFDVLATHYKNASDSNDLYFVTLTDNLSCDAHKLKKLRAAVFEEYVDEKGNMKEANKGLKEMKISASWLRSIKEDSVEAEGCAPILYARTSNGHLQYIFCLMRPKKVAIISSLFEKGRKYNKNKFIEISWGIFTPNEFETLSNKSYEFILFDDNAEYTKIEDGVQVVENQEDIYRRLRQVSSSRLHKLSEVCGNGGFPSYDDLCHKIEAGFDKQEAERLLTELYRYIADFREGDGIYVMDKKAQIPEDENSIVVVCDSDGGLQDIPPYVYLSHYETEENFNAVLKESMEGGRYFGNLFIEGITGNNSTDRLIRNEKLDALWSYKHLHAMKERIAIFDERIFSKVYGLEEKDFTDDYLKRLQTSYLRYFTRNSAYKDYLEEICNELGKDSIAKIEETAKDLDVPVEEYIQAKDLICSTYTGTALAQKGINIFTFIRSEDGNSFKLCGLRWGMNDIEGVASTLRREKNKCFSKCEVLAIVSWDAENGKLLIEKDSEADTPTERYSRLYDKISIHQGLLDKLYEGFGIKDNKAAKESLTKGLYEFLSNRNGGAFNINGTEDQWYLPGMCIHSGRSKPNETDMPQHLPFIQYAAIEHAVLDCKYSLVDLLDFARYE